MRSLQSKLSNGLILSLIIVFTGLWLLISISIQTLAEEYIASRLRHDAEMLLSTVQITEDGHLTLDESVIDLVYSKPFSGHYYLITSEKHILRSRSLWDQQLQAASVGAGERIHTHEHGPDGQSLLVLSSGFRKQGHRLSVTVAEDLDPVKESISQFQTRFAISAIAMLLLLVVLQNYILRHSLKSLATMRSELKALQTGEIEQLNTDTPTELQPLVNEINRLLSVMARRLRISRDSLGDLAHEIKKPLTVIQQLTGKQRSDLPDNLQKALIKQTVQISRLTDRILKRARLAGHRQSGMRFSFSQDLPDLIGTLDSMYSEKPVIVKLEVDEGINYLIDREDMLELLGNLLDNSYKWARQTISVSIKGKSGLNICIEDDGPGVEPEKLQHLDQRGVRLDETKHGYGLGLGIASDIVREYNGNLVFGRSETLGGFSVSVTLPAE